ncbi:mucin-5AC-like [Coregonus clupeaformis]|uniref:mucin-5AC-like n=1 Tax=Coregonus clupeaformis TaxID=59861 RepID=UPI001E1C3044|nr:mucin-5AC-like [Coregonus clupeaformis]
MDIPDDSRTSFTVTTENTDRGTTESYTRSDATPIESTFTHGPDITGRISETQSETVTPYIPSVSRSSGSSGELYDLERNTTVHLRQPVTLRLTVTDTTDETRILFSGEAPAEPETSTGAVQSLLTDPNVTPMMDSPRSPPREPEIHTATDPDSQTTFTAVTTTEREQDEITFHTTQRIKSPRLPAGSTIISRQQIHIIPPKNGRGGGGRGGRRRNYPGRRRFIKPNRITDIQSILNKLKQPTTVKKRGNNTVSYTMELTTDCDCDEDGKKKTGGQRVITPTTSPKSPKVPSSSLGRTERPISTTLDTPTTTYSTEAPTTTTQPTLTHSQSRGEVSSGYMTSADAPESDPTHDPMTSTTDEPTTSTTVTTTTASKVVHAKINWGRVFGNKARQKEKLNRLRKPAWPTTTTTEGSTTVQPTTTTTTALPTQRSLAEPVTESPSRAGKHRETPEGSSDDDYGDSWPDSEASTTPQPATSRGTTAPAYDYRSSTTTESSP